MNLGMSEMIFIFILALLIFGPRKLPEIAREVGKFMAEFKRAGNEFRNQIETEIQNLELEEQIKKDAERREAAMREAEQKRLEAGNPTATEGQGELFENANPSAQTARDEDGAPGLEEMPKILPPEGTVVNTDATPRSSLEERQPPVIEAETAPHHADFGLGGDSETESEHQTEPNA